MNGHRHELFAAQCIGLRYRRLDARRGHMGSQQLVVASLPACCLAEKNSMCHELDVRGSHCILDTLGITNRPRTLYRCLQARQREAVEE